MGIPWNGRGDRSRIYICCTLFPALVRFFLLACKVASSLWSCCIKAFKPNSTREIIFSFLTIFLSLDLSISSFLSLDSEGLNCGCFLIGCTWKVGCGDCIGCNKEDHKDRKNDFSIHWKLFIPGNYDQWRYLFLFSRSLSIWSNRLLRIREFGLSTDMDFFLGIGSFVML